jgi:hypothetical protein
MLLIYVGLYIIYILIIFDSNSVKSTGIWMEDVLGYFTCVTESGTTWIQLASSQVRSLKLQLSYSTTGLWSYSAMTIHHNNHATCVDTTMTRPMKLYNEWRHMHQTISSEHNMLTCNNPCNAADILSVLILYALLGYIMHIWHIQWLLSTMICLTQSIQAT